MLALHLHTPARPRGDVSETCSVDDLYQASCPHEQKAHGLTADGHGCDGQLKDVCDAHGLC